jgi:hypothetical protein
VLFGASDIADQNALPRDLRCKTVVAEEGCHSLGVRVKACSSGLGRSVPGENHCRQECFDL